MHNGYRVNVETPDQPITTIQLLDALQASSILMDLCGRFPQRGVGESRDHDDTHVIAVDGRTFRGATRMEALIAARDGLPTAVEQQTQ